MKQHSTQTFTPNLSFSCRNSYDNKAGTKDNTMYRVQAGLDLECRQLCMPSAQNCQ